MKPRTQTVRLYLLAFIASALLANAIIGERGAIEMRRARRDSRTLSASIAALRTENAALRNEARLLQSDRRTIEAVARRELGLARSDERLVIVRKPK
jgi:cell division protein FtsB